MTGAREGSGPGTVGPAARVMLFRASGCTLALSLDSVDGVFELVREPGEERARVPENGSVPLVEWRSLTGVEPIPEETEPSEVVVVSAGGRSVGLPVERCLGTRRISLSAADPLPTRLVDGRGAPACLLLRIDGRLVFLLEPRALAGAAHLALGPDTPLATDPVEPGAAVGDR